jgi:hypothetical protein
MKRRSPLDPVSNSTLIVFCLTISLLLALLEGSRNLPRFLEDLFISFFFEFSHLLGLLNDFPGLAFRELLGLSPQNFNIATTAVTLPVFEVSIVISLALDTSTANLVALIGRVSMDSKLDCSNLRHLSVKLPVLLDPLS